MEKKKIFIICPVRNVNKKVRNKIAEYVQDLETQGQEVFWPDRDNLYQKMDPIGIVICSYNRKKMLEADEVHIWYDKSSTGSVFDLGMFFMILEIYDFRKFVIANKDEVRPTPHKSFENVLLALERDYDKVTQK